MRKILFFYSVFIYIIESIVCDTDLYEPIFFKEEEVRHIRDSPKPICLDEILIEILAKCQITNPESIVRIAINNLDSGCRLISSQTRKLDKIFKNCTASPGLYFNLINGLKSLDQNLCKNTDFYEKYDIYDKCITDLSKDYESCDGTADWNEDEDYIKLCKTYKMMLDCYYIKTAKVCGLNAASILKQLLIIVIDCTVSTNCPVGSNPYVPDAMSEKFVQKLNKGHNLEDRKSMQRIFLNFLLTAIIYTLLY